MISFSDIAKFFEEIEMRLVASLKRNLSRHKQEEKDEGFEWSAWQAEKLRSVDRFRKENADIVGEYTEVIDKDTRELMQEQFREGEKLAEETIEKTLGTDAPKKLSTEPVPQFFGVDSNKVDSLIQDITTLEKNVETAALRMTDDVYRQTLHRTQLALSTGSMTLEQAIDISVKDFLDKGINCIVYKDGRRVNIADYVRMALRTTETRAKLQGMSKRARELGYDTVLVSQYSMCSDTCLPWQGRVYIEDMFVLWDGEVEERDNGELWGKSHYCGKWFPLLSTAVHKGLFHPNCRHSITVWIEGVSVLPAKLDGAEIKKKSALEQQQRRLENEVRKAKRLVEGTLDSDNVKENKRKLREAQKKLKEFIDEHPDTLRRDYKREKIYTADEPKRPKVENMTLKSYGNAKKRTNYAKPVDVFNVDEVPDDAKITPEQIYDELKTTNEGIDALETAKNLPQRLKLDYKPKAGGLRGEENRGDIIIYLDNCKDVKTAACAVIHECTHYKYGIGQSQWAECVCIAHELMHRRGRSSLTISEKRAIIKAVKEAYYDLNWRKGGYINGRKK